MKYSTHKVFAIILLTILPVSLGFADEVGEETPRWFPLLELFGSLIGIITSSILFRIYSATKGGALGAGIRFIMIGVLLLTGGVLFNGLNEMMEFTGGFAAHLILEISTYMALIAIGIGAKKIAVIA